MRTILAMLAGAAVGILMAPFTIYAFESSLTSPVLRLAVGATVGGVFGAIFASISSSANQGNESHGSKSAAGFLGGVVTGGIGGAQYYAILTMILGLLSKAKDLTI